MSQDSRRPFGRQRSNTIAPGDNAVKLASFLLILVDETGERVGVGYFTSQPSAGVDLVARDGRVWTIQRASRTTQVACLYLVVVVPKKTDRCRESPVNVRVPSDEVDPVLKQPRVGTSV